MGVSTKPQDRAGFLGLIAGVSLGFAGRELAQLLDDFANMILDHSGVPALAVVHLVVFALAYAIGATVALNLWPGSSPTRLVAAAWIFLAAVVFTWILAASVAGYHLVRS